MLGRPRAVALLIASCSACASAAGDGSAGGDATADTSADTAQLADIQGGDAAGRADTALADGSPADTGADSASPRSGGPDSANSDSANSDLSADASGPACQVPGKGAGTCLPTAACTGTATPGYCPGPKDIQCCTPVAASGTCDPSAAPLPNQGLGAEPPGLGGCPAGMARIDPAGKPSYCVDRWEAALQVVDSGAEFSPYHNPGSVAVRAVARPGQVPQAYINGLQAKAACAAAGKRLCSDGEWLRACQGPSAWTYPYGAQKVPKACNDSRTVHPAVELYGTSDAWIWSKLDNACLDQLPDSLAKTAAYSGCFSAEGLFDLMGNLHEWTADPAGTFRGGYFVDTVLNGPGCLYATTAHDTGHWDYSTGFRCCADLP
ncbi:MAG: SUMF1/EgtB/PvdO family nonheme iron enzyme [Deltaproteobacteria bacterium]|nr:SUMF1/EgtB/PvdO family nonheme iron enzyme [Deltaproteobacteria bacterium]